VTPPTAVLDPFSIAADIFDPPEWEPEDRPPPLAHQIPPDNIGTDDNKLWLLEAGRGSGKTEACSRYFCKFMRKYPNARARIIAPTLGDAVEACIEGPSGILAMDPEARWIPSAPGGSKIKWPNGSEALVIGTNAPKDVERLRAGGNRHLDWWEEMAANPYLKDAWDQAAFGLRLGEFPHAIASSTPRNTKAYRAIRNMDETILTKASMFDNIEHLPESFITMMRKKYEGTRLGRQELYGELLEDIDGAFWKAAMIADALYGGELPDMVDLVIAVDPAVSSNSEADDTGIIAAGLGTDRYGYVLGDHTCHEDPESWARIAVEAYHHYRADRIVAEVNNGGDMVEAVIRAVDPTVPFKKVHASRGKATRAEPVATLYGNGTDFFPTQIRHVPNLTELEDQLTTWVPGESNSPDRLDALVWALTDIFFSEQETEDIVEDYEPIRIGVAL
jgi:phage terminase large subunit-like protein